MRVAQAFLAQELSLQDHNLNSFYRIRDSGRHNYVLKETAEDADVGEYDQYISQVRPKFDWESLVKYRLAFLSPDDAKSRLVPGPHTGN